MRTFKLTINEDELKSLINYHASHMNYVNGFEVDRSSRIHDLTKRLNKRADDKNEAEEYDTVDNSPPKATENDKPKLEGWS